MFITEKLKNRHTESYHTETTSKLHSFFFLFHFDCLAFYFFCDIIHSLVDLFLNDIIIFDRVQMHPLQKASHPVAGIFFLEVSS